MAMSDERELDDLLEPFFAAGRHAAPDLSASVLARMEAAGAAAQPDPAPLHPQARQAWRWFVGFGGWGAFGGMATAALIGVWLGVAGSEQFLTGAQSGTASEAALYADSDILVLAGE